MAIICCGTEMETKVNTRIDKNRITAFDYKGVIIGKNLLLYLVLSIILSSNTYLLFAECYPSQMGRTARNFPDNVSPESILKKVGISPDICSAAMKKWPYQDSIFIVYAEDNLEYHIFILKHTGETYNVLSHYQSTFGENSYRFRSFDFAPYTLNKNQTAFGIRFFTRGPAMGGGWECEKLVLYENVNNQINPIMSTLVYYLAEGNNTAYDANSSFYCEEKGVIIIGQPDKSGYNRIIEKVGNKKYVFKYNSGMYTTDKFPECLSNSVSNCFCPEE